MLTSIIKCLLLHVQCSAMINIQKLKTERSLDVSVRDRTSIKARAKIKC